MTLTLKVLSFKNQPITGINAVSIDNNGGTIGRSDDNALVLPDTEKFVSRHHASIKVVDNCYYLTDTSLGGIYINGQETPLHNATERIENGTVLKIGEYEIAVAIINEQISDDFPFSSEAVVQKQESFPQLDESWLGPENVGLNSLMTDNFPKHEELVQKNGNEHPVIFESDLQGNNSPLFDSYIAPNIIPPPPIEEIPENLSFDDLFSETDLVDGNTQPHSAQIITKATFDDDFEAFLGAAISEMASDIENAAPLVEDIHGSFESVDVFASNETAIDRIEPRSPPVNAGISHEKSELADILESADLAEKKSIAEKPVQTLADNVLFNAFLQGAAIECNTIRLEQLSETMQRIGQMFRKLVDGTVAVLRSRAEFKSLCRVNMTVIRAAKNNPLKFTVSTDDVLRQLVENKTGGFLGSVAAIEESFNDIMNHQLAMQAGIQASLTDLLKTFDPKIIEKQFEQGIVLQKKAKCWDRYEETYRSTVEDAVENFFGEEFVKAYEKQMSLLTNSRNKNN